MHLDIIVLLYYASQILIMVRFNLIDDHFCKSFIARLSITTNV